jgi:hypothetical protein
LRSYTDMGNPKRVYATMTIQLFDFILFSRLETNLTVQKWIIIIIDQMVRDRFIVMKRFATHNSNRNGQDDCTILAVILAALPFLGRSVMK